MVREVDQLNEIKSKLADVHADVLAKLEQVRGEVSPEGQQAIDEITEALSSFDEEIGDADGSDTPAGGEGPTGINPDEQPTGGEGPQPTV